MTDETVQLPDDGSPPGHLEKMLGRKTVDPVEETGASGEVVGSNGDVAARPENIPEKFWDAEKGEVNTAALLKSQQDAEAALRQATGETDETPEETPAEEAPAQSAVVETASQEWADKGELSEATFKSLEGVGITREMVQTYIDGQQAIVSTLQSSAYEPFEGSAGYEEAANWAAANLSDDEIKAIDIQLTSNNPAIVKQGALALRRAHQAGADVEPQAIRGNANSSTSGTVYASRAEMIRDMRSPKYATDSGFRAEVMEKLRRSKL